MPRVLLPFAAVAVLLPLTLGCSHSERIAQHQKPNPTRAEFAPDQAKDMGKAIPFDGNRAMGYIRDICDIGPRISGSEGMAKQQELLKAHFEKHGGKVTLQKFEARQV